MKKKTEEERIESRKKAIKKYNMKTWYGISLKDYEDMLGSQDGKCAICSSTETKRKKAEYFIVDHDHSTGKVRGLLCDKCNKLLGAARDNINTLENAIAYLS